MLHSIVRSSRMSKGGKMFPCDEPRITPDETVQMLLRGPEGIAAFNELQERFPEWVPQLNDASFEDLCLDGALLTGADMRSVRMHRVSLRNGSLANVGMEGADLRNVDLSNTCGVGVNFTESSLEDVKWPDGQLDGAKFIEAKFQRVNFNGSRLVDVDFSLVEVMRKVDFTEADLTGAIINVPLRELLQTTGLETACGTHYAILAAMRAFGYGYELKR